MRPRNMTLSPAELAVFKLIGKGLTVKEIAEKRGVSVYTIDYQWRRIMWKLGIWSKDMLIHVATKALIDNGMFVRVVE